MEVDGKIDWMLMAMKVGHVIVTMVSAISVVLMKVAVNQGCNILLKELRYITFLALFHFLTSIDTCLFQLISQ